MRGFVEDIEKLTQENTDLRRVLYTAKHLQLLMMALQRGEDIGEEVHEDRDQFFRIESGSGEIVVDGAVSPVRTDMAIVVPAGARHNLRNIGPELLRLYSVYGPPEHRRGTVHRTKGDVTEEHFDGKTSE